MALVLDYSAGRPGAAAIKAAGYAGAVRYIGFPARAKCTTAGELADFTAHGLGMALVYEDSATDWLGGHARGHDAGARARAHATAIGFPADRPIYMAVDRDVVTAVEFAVMVEYLRGAAETLGGLDRVGVYGEFDVCVRAQQAGVATYFWQCRAWSGTPPRLFAARDLYQRVGTVRVGGIACDINDVLTPDWGQHNQHREDPVKNLILGRATDGSGEIWVGDGVSRRHIADEDELEGVQFWIGQRGGDPAVHDIADFRVLGCPMPVTVPVELDYGLLVSLLAARLGTLRFEAQPEGTT